MAFAVDEYSGVTFEVFGDKRQLAEGQSGISDSLVKHMNLSILNSLLMFNSFIAVPTSMAQRYNCDDLWRNCKLEAVYCKQDVEDRGAG